MQKEFFGLEDCDDESSTYSFSTHSHLYTEGICLLHVGLVDTSNINLYGYKQCTEQSMEGTEQSMENVSMFADRQKCLPSSFHHPQFRRLKCVSHYKALKVLREYFEYAESVGDNLDISSLFVCSLNGGVELNSCNTNTRLRRTAIRFVDGFNVVFEGHLNLDEFDHTINYVPRSHLKQKDVYVSPYVDFDYVDDEEVQKFVIPPGHVALYHQTLKTSLPEYKSWNSLSVGYFVSSVISNQPCSGIENFSVPKHFNNTQRCVWDFSAFNKHNLKFVHKWCVNNIEDKYLITVNIGGNNYKIIPHIITKSLLDYGDSYPSYSGPEKYIYTFHKYCETYINMSGEVGGILF